MKTPLFEGLYSEAGDNAHLIGNRCRSCGTYYFPKAKALCRHPDCDGSEFEDVPLSRTGKLWSWTNAAYKPPEPYVAVHPYLPFAIAAVELERERMVVLGQVVSGIDVSSMKLGMRMELVIESVPAEGNCEKAIWKWKPAGEKQQ